MPDKMIDLGREYDCGPCCSDSSPKGKKRISYPTLYLSGVKGLYLDTGEITFTAKGKVVSVSKRDKDGDPKTPGEEYSCEIEVHSISAPGASSDGGLEGELDAISAKKSKQMEMDAEEMDEEE